MELKSHRQAAKTLILHFLIQSHPALRTSYYYGQFALSLRGKDLSFTQILGPLNTDTFCGPLSVRIDEV